LIAVPDVAPDAMVGVPTYTLRLAESFAGTYIVRPVKVAVAYRFDAFTAIACDEVCVAPFTSPQWEQRKVNQDYRLMSPDVTHTLTDKEITEIDQND
jgi:hypothetical protein